MEVSIIIPVYNRAHIVGATLDSVVAQTHRPLQVVLVDNYSTDDTLQVLETFKKEHPSLDVVVTREEHRTAGAAATTASSWPRESGCCSLTAMTSWSPSWWNPM